MKIPTLMGDVCSINNLLIYYSLQNVNLHDESITEIVNKTYVNVRLI